MRASSGNLPPDTVEGKCWRRMKAADLKPGAMPAINSLKRWWARSEVFSDGTSSMGFTTRRRALSTGLTGQDGPDVAECLLAQSSAASSNAGAKGLRNCTPSSRRPFAKSSLNTSGIWFKRAVAQICASQ